MPGDANSAHFSRNVDSLRVYCHWLDTDGHPQTTLGNFVECSTDISWTDVGCFQFNPAPKFAFRIGHCAFEVQDGHWEALYCTVCSINFVSDWYWLKCEFKLHLYSDVVSTCRKSGQIKMTMFEKKAQTWHPSHARSKPVGQDEIVCVCSYVLVCTKLYKNGLDSRERYRQSEAQTNTSQTYPNYLNILYWSSRKNVFARLKFVESSIIFGISSICEILTNYNQFLVEPHRKS